MYYTISVIHEDTVFKWEKDTSGQALPSTNKKDEKIIGKLKEGTNNFGLEVLSERLTKK